MFCLSPGWESAQLLFLKLFFPFSFQKPNYSDLCFLDSVSQLTQAYFTLFKFVILKFLSPKSHLFFLPYGLPCYTCMLSHVRLFVTPWMLAHQAPLSMGFSGQEYKNGLLFPTPENLPNPGTEPTSLASSALAGGFFTTALPEKPTCSLLHSSSHPLTSSALQFVWDFILFFLCKICLFRIFKFPLMYVQQN